jgi:polyribonucleotide nucleotidyltransferase
MNQESTIINPFDQKYQEYSTIFAGKELKVKTGHIAFQSDASAVVSYGDTVVLANICIAKQAREGIDFFPLMVEYEEKLYAAGKISGSRFIKREGRPSEQAILTSRLIDRPLRPLFPKGLRNDVQIVITALSIDEDCDIDLLSIIAASVLVSMTDLPYQGPVAAARIGVVDRKLIINPDKSQKEQSRMNLTVAGTKNAILMVEAMSHEVQESTIVKGLSTALDSWQSVIEMQEQIASDFKSKQLTPHQYEIKNTDEELYLMVKEFVEDKLGDGIRHANKKVRENLIEDIKDMVISKYSISLEAADVAEYIKEGQDALDNKYEKSSVIDAFNKVIDAEIRRSILEEDLRPDHRRFDQIRPLSSIVSVLPRTHGSAIFTRGTTQALDIVTLGSVGHAQTIETMSEDYEKNYMHHYNFPPFSTGEAKPMRGTGRREIGHGALAERALQPVLPSVEDFPYSIRVVSEILSSSGSTSMASVCGSTLALMDAGVPISKPVSGIAMGLMVDKADNSRYVVLSDIMDAEDFAGDMDFKVAGTVDGITALQMDIKLTGLELSIMEVALEQAKKGRLEILDHLTSVIAEPRSQLSPYAPKVNKIKIPVDKIKVVIGKGGETIQSITAATKVDINIGDDGLIIISGVSSDGIDKAVSMIEALVEEPKVGKIYNDVPVVNVMEFGAFITFMPGKDGLVHVSEFGCSREEDINDFVKVGDSLNVELVDIDRNGRYKLSLVK